MTYKLVLPIYKLVPSERLAAMAGTQIKFKNSQYSVIKFKLKNYF